MKMTDCECTEPGWCARHKCEKDQFLFEHCRRLENWFQFWEQGCGPGQKMGTEGQTLRTPCKLRGPETRREQCSTCTTRVELKIFACSLHSECTLAKPLEAMACCQLCPDYQVV